MEIQPTTGFALDFCKTLDQMREGKTDSYSLSSNQTAWQNRMGANGRVFLIGLKLTYFPPKLRRTW